jgi:hypothetical protein
VISLNNKPILFVNSISNSINGIENQRIYDSRRIIKSRVLHRIDDIIAIKTMNKKIYITITCNDLFYSGEFISVDKYFIYIRYNLEIFKINISYITDIKITTFE